MAEQPQNLTDKTTAVFQQGKTSPGPVSVSPAGAMILSYPPQVLDGPSSSGLLPVGPAFRRRPPRGSHMPMMPGPPMMRPPVRPMMVPTWPGMTWPDREEQKGPSSVFYYSFYFSRRPQC
ncbi:hypothetical protein LEMLEM_LOCUS24887 [Lemmus lemmus]